MPALGQIFNELKSGAKAGWANSLEHLHSQAPDLQEGASFPTKVGDTLGAIAAGIAGERGRGWVWLNNHPLGTQSFIGRRLGDAINERVVNKEGGRFVNPVLVGGALSLGALPILSGNINPLNLGQGGRVAGYSAVFPDIEDPTKSTNPVAEIGARYFLGRKGKLLTPSQGFFEERPDVSAEDYARAQHEMGFMSKSFFGLEKNRLAAAGIGAGLGALIGAGPGHLTDAIIHKEQLPVGVGKRGKIGAIAGAIAGALLPEIVQTGFVKGGSNLDGTPTIAQLGYEVPLPALGATLALAAGARYGIPALVKREIIPGAMKSPKSNKVITLRPGEPSLGEQARRAEALSYEGQW